MRADGSSRQSPWAADGPHHPRKQLVEDLRRFEEETRRDVERIRAELRATAEEWRASTPSAHDRTPPPYDEKLNRYGIDRARWEAMICAHDEARAEMARKLEERRTGPPSLASAIVGGSLSTLVGAARALEVAYDGDLSGLAYGTPAQARAFRALREDGDAQHFLRVEGTGGEKALLLDMLKLNLLPAEAFADEATRADADKNEPHASRSCAKPRTRSARASVRSAASVRRPRRPAGRRERRLSRL